MSKVEVKKIATLHGHKDCIYTLEQTSEPEIFVSSGGDGHVAWWDLRNTEEGRVIAKVPNSVYALCYDEKPSRLIIGQNFDGIHVIDWHNKKEVGSLKLTNSQIFDIKVDDGKIYAGCGDGTIYKIDKKTFSIAGSVKDSAQRVRSLAINPDRGELVAGFSDNNIRIYDLERLELKKTINAHKNSVFTLKYNADYKFLLSGSRDAHLKIWSVEDNYELAESVVAHMYTINNIEFSPDGKHFVTCSMDKSIKVWDATTFKLLKVIDKARHAGHGTSVNKLLWTKFENKLISGSDDRTISVWDLNFNN